MRRQAIVMIIQKTTNVEPVSPIQHLQFYTGKISNVKRSNYTSQQLNTVLKVIVILVHRVIEEVHVFELIVFETEIIFFLPGFLTSATRSFFHFGFGYVKLVEVWVPIVLFFHFIPIVHLFCAIA